MMTFVIVLVHGVVAVAVAVFVVVVAIAYADIVATAVVLAT